MKKWNRLLLKSYNHLLALGLCLLGLGSLAGCEKNNAVEYGAPHADYVIKGKVISAEDGKPLEKIRLEIGITEEWIYGRERDTLLTNDKGEFKWEKKNEWISKIRIVASEPDTPPEKAIFLPDTVHVSFKDAEFTGGKGWYNGKAEIEQIIQMKKAPETIGCFEDEKREDINNQ